MDTIKVGDVVRFKVAPTQQTFMGLGTVLSLHDDRAWVKFDCRVIPISPLVDHLERVITDGNVH